MSTDFETWWAANHPFDWWKKEHGEPLPDKYRLNVAEIARKAYEAGELPPELFDGNTVLKELRRNKSNASSNDVADVLDAVVALIRRRQRKQ